MATYPTTVALPLAAYATTSNNCKCVPTYTLASNTAGTTAVLGSASTTTLAASYAQSGTTIAATLTLTFATTSEINTLIATTDVTETYYIVTTLTNGQAIVVSAAFNIVACPAPLAVSSYTLFTGAASVNIWDINGDSTSGTITLPVRDTLA